LLHEGLRQHALLRQLLLLRCLHQQRRQAGRRPVWAARQQVLHSRHGP
jgi:hypothetical protein